MNRPLPSIVSTNHKARSQGVMVVCPNRKELLHTGIWMDAASFMASPMSGYSVFCPHCNTLHVWSKKDAILV